MAKAHQAYYDALTADRRFQVELERVYGKRKASEARYYPQHNDAKLIEAKAAKRAADARLEEITFAQREGPLRRANPARRKKAATRKKAVRRKAPARKTGGRQARKSYLVRYDNGRRETFQAKSDAAALRYVNGLGKSRAGAGGPVSLKPTAAPRKKKATRARRRAV